MRRGVWQVIVPSAVLRLAPEPLPGPVSLPDVLAFATRKSRTWVSFPRVTTRAVEVTTALVTIELGLISTINARNTAPNAMRRQRRGLARLTIQG